MIETTLTCGSCRWCFGSGLPEMHKCTIAPPVLVPGMNAEPEVSPSDPACRSWDPSDQTLKRCETCQFWEREDVADAPECHRRAPSNWQGQASFPISDKDQWCGEWRLRIP